MKSWPKISDIAMSVNSGKVTAKSLVEESINEIKANLDGGAIIAVLEENALSRAKSIDDIVSSGKNAGKLAGVPFIAKDNFLVFGSDTTAASNMLRGFKAPYQATVINKLEKEGAICVAKANLDAFAHGSSTENSDFMVTKNPYDNTRVSGGSSGGSVVGVALGLAPFALGSDTGGSIRMPASLCGVVGFKPSYGLISRSGVVAMASSTDCIGPITNNVDDAALVTEIMAGVDPLDSTTINVNIGDFSKLDDSKKKVRVGVIKEYMESGLQPGVLAQTNKAIEDLKIAGHEVNEVSLASLPLALAVYYVLCPAEVSSNLSRYDGIKYGFSSGDAADLEQTYIKNRSQGFGDEAKRRIMIGTYVLSSGYYDAYYKKAQLVRTELINEFNEAFKNHDILLGPTIATTAFKIGENTKDPLAMYLTDIMTVAANLVGIPAISIPNGMSEGLPVGLQLMAPIKEDKKLLEFAKQSMELIK